MVAEHNFFVVIVLGERMPPQSKVGKSLQVQRELMRNLHLPHSKEMSGDSNLRLFRYKTLFCFTRPTLSNSGEKKNYFFFYMYFIVCKTIFFKKMLHNKNFCQMM